MKVGLTASRLGGAIYIIPFLFALDPALILHGGAWQIAQAFSTAGLGMIFIASALQGYLVGIGRLEFGKVGGYLLRIALFSSGLLLGLPGWQMDISGLAIVLVILLVMLLLKRRAMSVESTPETRHFGGLDKLSSSQ